MPMMDVFGVVGIVTDKKIGVGLKNVYVRVEETGMQTVTTPQGAYALPGLISGQTYRLVAWTLAYQKELKTVTNPANGPPWVQCDFALARLP